MAARCVLLLLFIFHLQPEVLSVATPSANDFSYMDFVYNATHFPPEEEYDYIVIGGGTAGCPLAATLSENYSVLLLERGAVPLEYPNVLNLDGFRITLNAEDDGNTPVQKFTSEDGIANARGRILGGSSMINAAFYSRADLNFYQESGIEWDMDLVEKAYQWVEESIVFQSNLTLLQAAVKDALLEANVVPDNGFTLNHKIGTKVSGSIFDASGRRHGAVELLNKAEPKNLRVAVHAIVERIIFSSFTVRGAKKGLSAIGVIYSDSNDMSHRAIVRDKGEIILSAGAIGSPQLLLLSGVGPRSYLSSQQILIVHNQPFVAHFVTDNPRNAIQIVLPINPNETSYLQVVGIEKDFIIESSSSNIPSSPIYGANIAQKVSRPLSKGSYRLASSTDVRVSPMIKFNYFADPLDLAHCVSGTRKIGELLMTRSLDRFKFQDLQGARDFKFVGLSLPVNQSNDASMEEFCRRSVTTIWHYHGGCVVGKVVDGGLRVMGINALRIVDGSIFTVSPGTNPQATLMMLGRYAGLKILKMRMTER